MPFFGTLCALRLASQSRPLHRFQAKPRLKLLKCRKRRRRMQAHALTRHTRGLLEEVDARFEALFARLGRVAERVERAAALQGSPSPTSSPSTPFGGCAATAPCTPESRRELGNGCFSGSDPFALELPGPIEVEAEGQDEAMEGSPLMLPAPPSVEEVEDEEAEVAVSSGEEDEEATASRNAGDTVLMELKGKKAKIEQAQIEMATLVEGGLDEATRSTSISSLIGLLGDVGLDPSIVLAVPSALGKAPEARGPFDVLVVAQLREQLASHFAGVATALARAKAEQAEADELAELADDEGLPLAGGRADAAGRVCTDAAGQGTVAMEDHSGSESD